jgi:hypothetical protein
MMRGEHPNYLFDQPARVRHAPGCKAKARGRTWDWPGLCRPRAAGQQCGDRLM